MTYEVWPDWTADTFEAKAALAGQLATSDWAGAVGDNLDAILADLAAFKGTYSDLDAALRAGTSTNVVNACSPDFGMSTSATEAENAAALNDAVDAVVAAGGGIVRIDAGTFDVELDALNFPSDVQIVGAGKDATTLAFAGTGNAIEFRGTNTGLSSSGHVKRSGLHRLTISGGALVVGVNCEHASSLVFSDFTVNGCLVGVRGFGFWDSYFGGDWRIIDCIGGMFLAADNDSGGEVVDTNNIRLLGGTIESCRTYDLHVTGKGVDGTGTGAQKPSNIRSFATKFETGYVQNGPRIHFDLAAHSCVLGAELVMTAFDSGYTTPVDVVKIEDSYDVQVVASCVGGSGPTPVDNWFHLDGTDLCTVWPMVAQINAPANAHIKFSNTNRLVDYPVDGVMSSPDWIPGSFTIDGAPTSTRGTYVRADGQVAMTANLILADGSAAASKADVAAANAGTALVAELRADVNAKFKTGVIDLGTSSSGAASTTNRGSAISVDAEYPFHRIVLGTNTTLAFARSFVLPTAATFRLLVTQDATGSRTITWPSSVKWPAGTAPTLTATASRSDLFEFVTFDGGTTWMGRTLAQNYTGV